MSSPSAKSAPVFSPATAILLVLVVAFALSAFFVLSAYAPDLQRGQDGGANAMSRSGVGFAGLPELLRLQGRAALVTRRPPLSHGASGSRGLLILTPSPMADSQSLHGSGFEGPILIVLPKWQTRALPDHAGWVERAPDAFPTEVLGRLLAAYDSDVSIDHRTTTAAPVLSHSGQPFARPGPVVTLQTISGRDLTPVLVDETGATVLAQVQKTNVYVLADPDLMNNQGLHNLATAQSAEAIIDLVREGDGPVMFDVSMNGYRSAASLLRLLFDPPFLAVTLCLVGAAILLGIHATARFGPTLATGRVFAFGGRALADNTAALIRLAGREAAMGPRYALLVRGLAAKALAAPKDLTPAALTDFLDRMGRQRGAADTLSHLTEDAGRVTRPGDLVTIAQRLHRWRLEMTREHK